jgi:hypothetical protein
VQVAIPKECYPFTPFPVGSLPRPLGCVVEEAAAAIGCDPVYVALPVLSIVAAAIGHSRSIQLKKGWEEPPIVWAGIVGESGTLKTPACKFALSPVYAVERDYRREFGRAHSAYEADHADTPKAQRPPRPVMRRAYCSDVTIEKLAQLLEDNPKGLLVARDELSGWLGSFKKYKNSGTDLPDWLQIHSGAPINVDRKTGDRPTVYVERAAASVIGGIQPAVLGCILTGANFDCGLAARMLLALPPRRRKKWSDAEVSDATAETYEKLVRDLYALTMRQVDEGRFVPHRRRFSPEAQQAWVAFYDEFAGEQADARGHLAAALSKLEGYAARFALIHHVVTHIGLDTHDDRPVGPASVESAVALTRWFVRETRRVYAAIRESDAEAQARSLIDWLRARPEQSATPRDVQRFNCARYPTADAAGAALDALTDAGLGCWEDVPPGERGRHPGRRFRLNDTMTDMTQPADDGAHA